MAVKPSILIKLDLMISAVSTFGVIHLSQADWKAYFSHHVISGGSITPSGHMLYRGHQIRLNPVGRERA